MNGMHFHNYLMAHTCTNVAIGHSIIAEFPDTIINFYLLIQEQLCTPISS